MSVRELFFEDNELALMNLYSGDCPTRFHAYATACSEMFGNSSAEASTTYMLFIINYNALNHMCN